MNMRSTLFHLIISWLFVFALGGQTLAAEYTFQGKAAAKIQRAVTVPFHMQVTEVLVRIGQTVKKGAPLVRYAMLPQEAKTWQNVILSQSLNMTATRQQFAAAEHDAVNAGYAYRRDRELNRENLAPAAELARSGAALKIQQIRKEQLKEQLRQQERESAYVMEEVNSYFGGDLKKGDVLPRVCTLVAPVDGTVIDVLGTVRPGGLVGPNAPAVTLATLDPIQAEIQVFEAEISKLKVGDVAVVEVPNLGGKKFSGTVSAISWKSSDMTIGTPSFYIVVLDIGNRDHELRPGYKVLATVTTQQ